MCFADINRRAKPHVPCCVGSEFLATEFHLHLVQTQISTSVPPATRHCVHTSVSTPWAATAVNAGRATSRKTTGGRAPRETNTPMTPVSRASKIIPLIGWTDGWMDVQALGSPTGFLGEQWAGRSIYLYKW